MLKKKSSIDVKELASDSVINIALDTLQRKKQALVFANTKNSAEANAERISLEIRKKGILKEEQSVFDGLSEYLLHSLSRPTKQCERLARCAKSGVVFHHAGLTHDQKSRIEDDFRKGVIRIICCTPTLAAGMDLPAFRAILVSLKRYSAHGLNWIPVLEYEQMSGRAGRPSYDNHGESIAIADNEKAREEIIDKFINGDVENIYSKLAVEPVLRTYLLSLIASGFVSTKKEIIAFFSKTFWASQFGDMRQLESIIMKTIRNLIEWKFIRQSSKHDENGNKSYEPAKKAKATEFMSAAEILGFGDDIKSNEKLDSTLIGKRVAELYIDPLTAKHILECLDNEEKLESKDISNDARCFALLQMISHTLEIRPLLRVKAKEWDSISEDFLPFQECLLEKEPDLYDPDYDEFFCSVKTALFINDWVNELDEESLLEKYDIRPGEIRVKLEIADWLLYCAEEFSKLQHHQPLIKEIVKARYRVKYGVKEELLALLQLREIGRVRARKLFSHGIKNIGDVRKADLTALKQILGEKTAISVKKQLDQEIRPVKENKRKGQISLEDYSE